MKAVVTGGRGFIGSHFVEEALKLGWKIIDIDKVSYASSKTLPWDDHPRYSFIKEDIVNLNHLPSCDILINFAAESHVDNSIKSSGEFLESNVKGVHNLLELVVGKPKYDRPLFVQISTDEVYGDRKTGIFVETDKLSPSNPYSATKASAEMLVLAYHRTYGIDYLITRSSNNYGPRQFEEKLISRCITSIKENTTIPIHGDGSYVRDWTYVKDNVSALLFLIDKKVKNDVYNIAAENYMTNMQVIDTVLSWYELEQPEKYKKFVENRWGQDVRYAVSAEKLSKLGWQPKYKNGLYRFIE